MKKIVMLSVCVQACIMNAAEVSRVAHVTTAPAELSADAAVIFSLITRNHDIKKITDFDYSDKVVNKVAFLMVNRKVSVIKPDSSGKSLADYAEERKSICPHMHEFIMYGKNAQSWREAHSFLDLCQLLEEPILATADREAIIAYTTLTAYALMPHE